MQQPLLVDLKSAVWRYQMCRHCRVIDQDHGRVRYGHLCSVCGKPGEGGLMYFEVSVHTLAALLQEANSLLMAQPLDAGGAKIHSVAIVIFFCTAREALLNWLIEHLCWAQRVPKGVFERLLADNNVHSRRQNALLPSLVGKKWKEIIAEETAASQTNYQALNDLLERAADARNTFVHEGEAWEIDRALASECIDQFATLLDLYVALHNRYVHPAHLKEVLA